MAFEIFGFQLFEKRNERLGLQQRFAARHGDAASFPEERTLAAGQFHQFFGIVERAFAFRVDGVGIGAVQALEVAAL